MILLTGANGFLGKQIYTKLEQVYKIETLGRSNTTYNLDIGNQEPIFTSNYDLVIHCAGKAHLVPKNESEKRDFFKVNVDGTKNILKALEQRSSLPKSFVLISSVAVYGKNSGWLINEMESLNATDPYGLSKIQAEKIVSDWCAKYNITCSILRLPLLIGANPLGNLNAMIKGIKKGYYFNIGAGDAKKSMVLVDDVAAIIPKVSNIGGIYNLTDGYHPNFAELSMLIAKQLKKRKPIFIPTKLAKIMAIIGDLMGRNAPINTEKLNKITADLTFDDSKARKQLGWKPNPVLNGFKIL